MTKPITPYRSDRPAGRDGFLQLLHAEWTKFRTVRGWVIGMSVAALLIVLLSVVTGAGSHSGICTGTSRSTVKCHVGHALVTIGPGGEPVDDSFYFVHRPLDGNGSITVRVTSLAGVILPGGALANVGPAGSPNLPASGRRAVQPWAKAGIILQQSTTPGSTYAAVMATGAHGVRMQYDYTQDVAGMPGRVTAESPRWLRLTRSGDVVTGYESTDGIRWTRVGSADLAALPRTVQVGLFVASPAYQQISQHVGGGSMTGALTLASARFDRLSLQGETSGTWAGKAITTPSGGVPAGAGGFRQAGNGFTVAGSGDIAPALDAGHTIGDTITAGAFIGLIAVIVVATMFMTAEYRRGLISTTLASSPRRGRVLAAKALVIGAVTFVAGLLGSIVGIVIAEPLLRHNGNYIYPAGALTDIRVVVGIAALLALAAVLALSVGTLLRRSAGAITAVVVIVVLPFILATASVLPAGPADWLLRVTPAAAFAVQQTIPQYLQVANNYTPAAGFFPLSPWAGFSVLCGYTVLALAAAAVRLRRRDA